MRYLLDTHALLWFLSDDPKLPPTVRAAVESDDADCFVSIASVWELAIKVSLGKLQVADGFSTLVLQELYHQDIDVLNVTVDHCLQLLSLPHHHRDPFDRIIICASIVDELILLSADNVMDLYGVKRVWG